MAGLQTISFAHGEANFPDYDAPPGTVYLVEGTHEAGAAQAIVLIPRPSQDIRDPLRWSHWRKLYHVICLVIYAAVLGCITQWESVIYLPLIQTFRIGVSSLNVGAALMLLMLGVGNCFFVPLSNKVGRRSVYLFSLVVVLAACLWLAFVDNIGGWQGAHVLIGLGAAPFEALPAISIADIFFAHERGGKIGWYVFGLSAGSFVGPICGGFVADNMGWRWIYRWGCIFTAVTILLFYFTFEETRFVRERGEEAIVDVPHRKAEELSIGSRNPSTAGDIQDKKSRELELAREIGTQPIAGEVFETDHWKPQLRLWQLFPGAWREVWLEFFRPLITCAFPAVIWCGINYGTCVSWLSVMGTTIAEVFSRPPYLFKSSSLGLIYISPLIGSLIGAIYAGPLNDIFIIRLSNRNKGWREPEFRLWALVPTAFVMACGLILYGVTSAHAMHWIIPILGAGFVGFGLSIGGTIAMAYIIDCYERIDTHVMTTVILIRNLVGFGITWGIQPWIDGMGQQNCFILTGVLAFLIMGPAALAFIFWGKRSRKATTSLYLKIAEQFEARNL
ncbi:putative MFS-type transporter [Cercospora beticola]|uniref:Putative MFS-type transporter n=1 Tax=Cercospora beticola TaxID=122368 RepID=A0A2G5I5C4_CERBT|nr:putative MFS-type transporter [Cercospora beticola]PIA99673.1 putative MFS-type transporter [Cercospora beticola]WPB00372.1 hypothetical protein RHO25_004991 [Cercospora beticola]CAK1361421.1 unnamed protein product [Cercospora beticola]